MRLQRLNRWAMSMRVSRSVKIVKYDVRTGIKTRKRLPTGQLAYIISLCGALLVVALASTANGAGYSDEAVRSANAYMKFKPNFHRSKDDKPASAPQPAAAPLQPLASSTLPQ